MIYSLYIHLFNNTSLIYSIYLLNIISYNEWYAEVYHEPF